jgi:taurine dioxygenase
LSIEIVPASPAVGAIVTGVDVDRLSEADADQLRQAFLTYGVLAFRQLGLDTKQQLVLSHVFGETVPHPVERVRHKDEPMLIVLAANEGQEVSDDDPDADEIIGVLHWHADMMYTEVPSRGSLLNAIRLPAVGGNTAWLDRAEVYRSLPDDVKAKIQDLQVLYSFEMTHRLQGVISKGESLFPDVIHPLVYNHPESGLPILNLSPTAAKAILGLPPQEAKELLDYLIDFTCREERAYLHRWEDGDAVLWDNWRMLHKTFGHPKRYPRVMHRTTLKSDFRLGRWVTADQAQESA